jgi:TRAP-type C4-dicarboxylate transport system substrate-binding protein
MIVAIVSLLFFGCGVKQAADSPQLDLDRWKPNFDPSGAKYKCVVSSVSHPALKGVYTGFAFRDELWKRTKGQIYIDYKPFSMLGGEPEVLNQLMLGAIQGMGVSSHASTSLGPRFRLIHLPFLINSFEKLDKFIASGKLFEHYMMAMDHRGIIGIDITGYGNYGWATTSPVRSVADAKKLKFKTAEAAVNRLIYKKWGIKTVAIPWPNINQAFNQGRLDGLDHTPIVCNLTKKFEVAKYFTSVNYSQGIFIWIFNKDWFHLLPSDLQYTFIAVFHEVCADIRMQTRQQEEVQIAKAMEHGVEFITLSEKDTDTLRHLGNAVHENYRSEINKLYKGDKYRPADYLKEVQAYMDFK